ncbi:MAG TPA: ACT domain-containing protein [Gemmatimonadaceae bacterium]|nr:ACT domain-containing protein [Gemmatimonadaceae bacterium]
MSVRHHLLLSATEKDRPGLVAELSGYIAERGCNVEDSRVAVLGGYAGLFFLISGDASEIDAAIEGLDAFESRTSIRAMARRLEAVSPDDKAPESAPAYVVTASAMDHEGIIHAITDVVRAHGANILELETSTESAPMTGSPLFALRMTITLSDRAAGADRLRGALESMARAEAIDLDVQPMAGREPSPRSMRQA